MGSNMPIHLVSVLMLSAIYQVEAYYCDNNRCDFDEYCCGHNKCCTSYNVLQMWYFWLGLVLFLILLASCFSFWRYRYQQALVVQGCSHDGYRRFGSELSIPSQQEDGGATVGMSKSNKSTNKEKQVKSPRYKKTPRES